MAEAEYSPTRTHATWKPRVADAHAPFYRCSECGTVVRGVDGDADNALIDDGERSKIFEPSYVKSKFEISCCGKPMEPLEPIPVEEVADRFTMNYQIVGGLNSNGLNVTWSSKDASCKPRWFAVKTFTGVQTKYVQPKKWPPIVFAFADEDAFAYCSKNPCIECTFRCKSGMELYGYVEGIGLVYMTIDRMQQPGK